jgi:hypothetical protein
MTNTTITSAWDTNDTTRTASVLTAEQAEANGLLLADGEFAMDLRFWDKDSSFFIIGRFTGRTRRCWQETCRTIETFDVDTVAIEDDRGETFALWGVRGARRKGTWACR